MISIPRTFWIFEARSSSLPAFLLALPYTLIKWWLSNASQQRRQIKFRRWTFVRVDSSVNTHTFQNFAISTQQKWQVSLGDFRYVLGKLITINLMYFEEKPSANEEGELRTGIHTLALIWIFDKDTWPADARACFLPSHFLGKSHGDEVTCFLTAKLNQLTEQAKNQINIKYLQKTLTQFWMLNNIQLNFYWLPWAEISMNSFPNKTVFACHIIVVAKLLQQRYPFCYPFWNACGGTKLFGSPLTSHCGPTTHLCWQKM